MMNKIVKEDYNAPIGKACYKAPQVKAVAFNVESGFEVSPQVEIRGFVRQFDPYHQINNDGDAFFGDNTYENGILNEGYDSYEFNW